jgi:peptidoglycan hydrolase-like protein with peptidoglycan-binding domain
MSFGCCALMSLLVVGEAADAASYFRSMEDTRTKHSFAQTVALQVPQANMIWLVVSSRPTYAEARSVAQSFASTLGPTLITKSRNGAYAILAGTLYKDKAKPNIRTLKELRLIPQDAFLSNGEGFDQIISHDYGSGASTDLMTQVSLITSVRRLQLAFMKLQLYSGATDGLIGPSTVKAFEAYTAAFGVPRSEFLDEYGLNIIEQSAQDGFKTVAERQTAQSMGFRDSVTYAEAMKGGFTSPDTFAEAKRRGFQTQREFDVALAAGFRDAEEFRKGRAGGFETADEYRAASRWQIGTRTDYVAFRSSGFPDVDTFQKARERGFADKPTYERALTADLKAARSKASILLEDAQTFIRLNPQIPNLIEIADKASVLGVTLPAGSTLNLENASSQLQNLLTPIAGYSDFAAAREKERADDRQKQVVADQQELQGIQSALTKWVAANISSSKLPQVVQELKLLAEAIPSNDLDRLRAAKQSVGTLISKNELTMELTAYTGAGAASPQPRQDESGAPFAVTQQNSVLLRGPREDVVALYNSSAGAPSLVRTLNGEFSFSRGFASVCFLGVEETPAVKRGLRAIVEPMGAKSLKTTECSAGSPQRADLLLIRRKAFLEAKPSLAVSFIDALEGKKLRLFQPIDYTKLAAREAQEAAFVAEITAGVKAGSRTGFGAIESPANNGNLCVIVAEGVGVHQEMLHAATALVEEPHFASTVSDQSLEQLYPEILRDKCRLFYGSASSLQQLSQALKRDERSFAFLPVWFAESTVAEASARVVAAEQEKIKTAEATRLAAEEKAHLAALRRNEELSRLVVVEADLQKTNGPAASARLYKFTDSLKASTVRSDASQPMPEFTRSFATWLQAQSKDGWELVAIDTMVGDFGNVVWKERKLDALVTRASVKFKSRERGEYKTECLLFGIVLDDEFDMVRDPVDGSCADDLAKMNAWKVGHGFESRWLATPPASGPNGG